MNIFSYILDDDSGFAPNPFFGCCTLCCCKPAIRRVAQVGDIIIGITPKAKGHNLAYMMRVTDKLTFADYWKAPRFQKKKPTYQRGGKAAQCGDNIYRPYRHGKYDFQQLRSGHSNFDGSENTDKMTHDLKGKYVLISDDFVYFGSNAIDLPPQFQQIVCGRGHKRLSRKGRQATAREITLMERLVEFFATLPRGIQGKPLKWPPRDGTWNARQHKRCRK